MNLKITEYILYTHRKIIHHQCHSNGSKNLYHTSRGGGEKKETVDEKSMFN